MSLREPHINDFVTRGRAKLYCKAHVRYRKVGLSSHPVAAQILTKVEVAVIQLKQCLPANAGRRHIPQAASLAYRQAISSTTRSGSGGTISRKRKKWLRRQAAEELVAALDFLDT